MRRRVVFNLDTSTIIEILRSNENVLKNLADAVSNDNVIAVSSIAYYEVMRGFEKSKSYKKKSPFQDIYKDVKHFSLTEKAVDIAIDLYQDLRRGQNIGDADIFIAAISIANGAVLVTDNVKHFGRIPNLDILNWK